MKTLFILAVIAAIAAICVEASSFTDIYSDYGSDTNSDGLFEYLVVNVSISITTAGDYSVFGELKDSLGNYHEAEDCRTFSIGTYGIPLKFNGADLYINKVDGPYNLNSVELYYWSGGCGNDPRPIETEDNRTNPYNTTYYNYTQFQPPPLHPATYCIVSPCIATAECAGDDEMNPPNTIDGCMGGDAGVCHQDESIENITITAADSLFIGGEPITVDVWTYCSSGDNINFVYTNTSANPGWRVIGYSYCSGNGIYSKSFKFDNIQGNHTIRAVVQNFGNTSATCGTGNFDDNDDVTLYVHKKGLQYVNISLHAGWNLISIPLELGNKQISNVFSGINYDSIYTHINGNYVLLNESNVVDIKKGYWINMNSNDSLELGGIIPNYPMIYSIKQGWNLIGYPHLLDSNINESLPNPLISKVNMYDDIWMSYHYNKPSILNSLQHFKPKYGYWIYSDKNSQLEFDSGKFSVYNPIWTINLNLDSGWNLISIPLNVTNNTVGNIFKDINYDEIYAYNNDYVLLNETSLITPQMGLWILMNNADTLTVTGYEVLNPKIDLNVGWNLVGYPRLSQKSVTLYYNKPEINTVFYYGSSWSSYSPSKNPKLNSLKVLKTGKGYWVYPTDNISVPLN